MIEGAGEGPYLGAAMERVALAPGMTRTIRFMLRDDELRFWSPALRKWVVEPETFDVWVVAIRPPRCTASPRSRGEHRGEVQIQGNGAPPGR